MSHWSGLRYRRSWARLPHFWGKTLSKLYFVWEMNEWVESFDSPVGKFSSSSSFVLSLYLKECGLTLGLFLIWFMRLNQEVVPKESNLLEEVPFSGRVYESWFVHSTKLYSRRNVLLPGKWILLELPKPPDCIPYFFGFLALFVPYKMSRVRDIWWWISAICVLRRHRNAALSRASFLSRFSQISSL